MHTPKLLRTFLLALGGFGLMSCAVENRIDRLADALAFPDIGQTEFQSRVPFEFLPFEGDGWLVRFELPEAAAELRIVNGLDMHQIRLDVGNQRLFEQDTSWDGELSAVRLYGHDVPATLAENQDETLMMRYMLACSEEAGWRCYIEALDVLAHLGLRTTDVYPALGLEKAALGLHRLAAFAEP